MGVNILSQQKEITVQLLEPGESCDKLLIDNALNTQPKYHIDQVCWEQVNNIPQVDFSIAYTPHALLLKYYITEYSHRARYIQTNEPVFKDSCVEFFIAVDGSGFYYNFEFNSLGTCLASYGSSRFNRIKLDAALIGNIDRWVTWKEHAPDRQLYKWELTFILPPKVFQYHHLNAFTAGNYPVNLYKCGDALPEPHYLAWNPVLSSVRDFHQPAYFGLLKLQ